MGEVVRYQAVVRLTLYVIDIAYCVYLFRHRIFYISFVLHPSIGLYPSICITSFMEPVTGTEPAYSAWKADVLPLNYTGMPRPVSRAGREK